MMEMDSRVVSSVKNPREGTNGINEKFNDNKDEIRNSVILFPLFKRSKT